MKTYRVDFYNSSGQFIRDVFVRADSKQKALELAESEHFEKYDCILDAQIGWWGSKKLSA